jgi:putative ABC transport system permease protein
MSGWDLGPIFRAVVRQRSTFWLLVLEAAMGFLVISGLAMSLSWYGQVGHASPGHPIEDLISLVVKAPVLDGGAAARIDLPAVRQTPGVVDVGWASDTLMDDRFGYPITISAGGAGSPIIPGFVIGVSRNLTDLLGVRMHTGQPLAASHEPDVAVITRCVADALFPQGSPLGRTVVAHQGRPLRVVGVAENFLMRMPYTLVADCLVLYPAPLLDERVGRYMVRTAPGLRDDVLARLRSDLAVPPHGRLDVLPFDTSLLRYRRVTDGVMLVVTIMGCLIGVVAITGALAMSSFLVAQRTRQIGVRRALGATAGDITRYFLLENLICTSFGVVLGLALAVPMLAAMASMFNGLQVRPALLGVSALLVLAGGALGALLPARRAARISPTAATRTI